VLENYSNYRERLLARKQAAQKIDVERFNLKKLSELQVRNQYQNKNLQVWRT
jgi:hypothetical protein